MPSCNGAASERSCNCQGDSAQRRRSLAALATGEKTTKAIKALVPGGSHAINQLLHVLTKAGEVRRVARGRYGLANNQSEVDA